MLKVLFVYSALVLLAACMGPAGGDGGGGFGGNPPPGSLPPGPVPQSPPGFALSSGGGLTTSASLKMKARIGSSKKGLTSTAPSGINVKLGLDRDLQDNTF